MTAPKKETVYYKPLPSPDVKATLERHLGGATWDDYKSAFKKKEFSKVITTLGKHAKMTAPQKETVYYKPLPSPDIKATLERHLGGATWDDYKTAFKKKECSNLITTSQHSRLLEHHPNKDKLNMI